jgi:glutamyl-tRNA synthetase
LQPVRVRFAPSPTGYLHVGGARTALINWLFARKQGGTFILRIEDTDEARSTPEMTQAILDGLGWLGMNWDEGPFFQSERRGLYSAMAERVLNGDHGYRCFCAREQLEARRAACAKPEEWRYDRLCLGLAKEVSDARAATGEPFVVRCRIPDVPLAWDDLVKGPIRFEPSELDDFVLLRSDGTPTYHLSVVSDDVDMRVTHVIRGEDHISNTPKQIALYQALEYPQPVFGHLSLIQGSDKKKLSKRHGVTSVMAYRDEGILPLALFNFLAQLGAYLGEEPYLPMKAILERFDLSALKKSASVFDREKLAFVNYKVILDTPASELRPLLMPFLREILPGRDIMEPEDAAIDVMKTRAKSLKDLAGMLIPFVTEDYPLDAKGLEQHARDSAAVSAVEKLRDRFEELPESEWAPMRLEEVLRKQAEEAGIKAGALIHLCRLFLTGTTASPGIFELIAAMTKAGTLRRITLGLHNVQKA